MLTTRKLAKIWINEANQQRWLKAGKLKSRIRKERKLMSIIKLWLFATTNLVISSVDT
jgi:hypothetical protein